MTLDPDRLVLTVNAGSSSVRFGVADLASAPARIVARERHDLADATDDRVRGFVAQQGGTLVAIAHRVVHAGPNHRRTCAFDEGLAADVAALAPLAPLHNPGTLAWRERCRALWPTVPQVAVFDSEFFADLPPVASVYALPAELARAWGLRRLGFHGLAHRSMWQTFARRRPERARRVVSFQLGSGCSAAALLDGHPIDTSMGFSPLEGLMMASRAGDLDPGMLLYLLTDKGVPAGHLTQIVNDRSGLLGVSEQSGDMRVLLASETAQARLAIDLYCYRARKYLGAYLAALGGCDAILLGGGVGERAPQIRLGILAGLEDLGVAVDRATNAQIEGEGRISAEGSRIEAWVVPTDEETVMVEEAAAWLASRP